MVITKGYLIHREDYDLFDEIITFINEYGIKFTCFSQGSRRIKSKNGRNLNFGDYLEFEIFYSENKLSRLKTVNTIHHIDSKYKLGWSLDLLNEFYLQMKLEHHKFFDLYQSVINGILSYQNDYLIMLYICIKIITLLKYELKNCSCCTNHESLRFNLDAFRFDCIKCQQQHHHYLNQNASLLIYKLKQSNKLYAIAIDEQLDITLIKNALKQILYYIGQKTNMFFKYIQAI